MLLATSRFIKGQSLGGSDIARVGLTIHIGKTLSVCVQDLEAARYRLDCPWCREAAHSVNHTTIAINEMGVSRSRPCIRRKTLPTKFGDLVHRVAGDLLIDTPHQNYCRRIGVGQPNG
jgi:hypothetical protein